MRLLLTKVVGIYTVVLAAPNKATVCVFVPQSFIVHVREVSLG